MSGIVKSSSVSDASKAFSFCDTMQATRNTNKMKSATRLTLRK
jgi:hypothetical protein